MSNSIHFLLVTTLLLFSVLKRANGIECYSCYHLEGGSVSDSDIEKISIGDIKGHKSCKSGKTPKDTYTASCNTNEDNTVASCVKLFYNGKFPDGDVEYKFTFRTCFVAYKNLTQTCEDRTVFDIGSLAATPAIKDLIKEYGPNIGGETTGTFCACDSDKCNNAMRSISSSFTISLLGFLLLTFSS